MQDAGAQTLTPSSSSAAISTASQSRADSSAQTAAEADEQAAGAGAAAPALPPLAPAAAAALVAAGARMLDELEKGARSSALRGYAPGDDPDESGDAAWSSSSSSSSPALLATFTQPFAQPDEAASLLRLPVTAVAWSASGALMAAAFGLREHAGWCRHRAGVAVWSAFRPPRSTATASAAPGVAAGGWAPEVVLETASCVSALACHPAEPSLVACGTFSGEIIVWDMSRGLRAEDHGASEGTGSGGTAAGGAGAGAGAGGDPLLCRTHGDDFLHREAVCGLCWAKDSSAGGPGGGGGGGGSGISGSGYLLLSLSREGKLLAWSLANRLAHPVSSAQTALPTSAGLRRGRGGGGGGDDSDEDEDGGEAAGGRRRGADASSSAAASSVVVGGASLAAPPEGLGLACYVGGEGGSVLRCELAASAAALATASHREGSPWRPEHRPGAVARADNALPWEQAAVEVLLRVDEADRARACRAAERHAREAGARLVTLGLLYESRPEAASPRALNMLFPSPVRAQLAPHTGAVCALAAHSQRRNLLASAGADGRLCVYSALRAQPLLELEAVSAASLSSASSTASTSASSSAAAAPEEAAGVVGLLCCAWSRANPLLLACGASDGGASLFDLFRSTGAPALVLRGAGSSGGDGGPPSAAFAAPAASVTALSFNPRAHEGGDARAGERQLVIAVGDAAGSVRLWRLPWRLTGEGRPTKAVLEAWLNDS